MSLKVNRTVRILAGEGEWPWRRQTPNGDGVFGGTRYLFGPFEEIDAEEDLLVVYEELPSSWVRHVDPARCIFFCGEPPTVKKYPEAFLAQFACVVSVDPSVRHPHLIRMQPALPWHVGVSVGRPETFHNALSFRDLLSEPAKEKLCSVICSDKAMTPEHRRRLEFVNLLMARLGDKIDRYGRGFRSIADKEEALAPYRYHIALENSSSTSYWTEKLADPFLRNCLPIYWGAPNVSEYFPEDSLIVINIHQPTKAIDRIAAAIESDADAIFRTSITRAKELVMMKHNLLAVLNDRFEAEKFGTSEVRVQLQPESAFTPGIITRVVRRMSNVFGSGAQ